MLSVAAMLTPNSDGTFHSSVGANPPGVSETQFVALAAGAYQARNARMLTDENFQKILRFYGGKLQKLFMEHLQKDASFMTLLDLTAKHDAEARLAQVSAMWVAGVFNSVMGNLAAFPDCREFLATRLPPGMATAVPAGSDKN